MHSTVTCKFNYELLVCDDTSHYIIFSLWFLLIIVLIDKNFLHILSTIGLGSNTKPLSVQTKAPMREQNLWVSFINGLMYKSKASLFHWAIYWDCWACFAALMLLCCFNTTLPLLHYIATVMHLATIMLICHWSCWVATHAAFQPLS